MNYEEEILKVLRESGNEGLSVKKISVHVYNSTNSFFDSPSFEVVKKEVIAFLRRNSGKSSSLVKRTSVRGHYCINMESYVLRQQKLHFIDESPIEDQIVKHDHSLSLFDV